MPLEIFDDASSLIVERSAREDSHLIISFTKWLTTTVSNSKMAGLFKSQMAEQGIWFWFSLQILEQHLQQLRRATFVRHLFGVCFYRFLCSSFRFGFVSLTQEKDSVWIHSHFRGSRVYGLQSPLGLYPGKLQGVASVIHTTNQTGDQSDENATD